MKARPILFSGAMVRALLDGSKTQTRRVLKHKVLANPPYFFSGETSTDLGYPASATEFWAGFRYGDYKPSGKPEIDGSALYVKCPYGKPGDQLWVRETWAGFDADGRHPGKPQDLRDGPWPMVAYQADGPIPSGAIGLWRPSIHMPRWANRILLEITDVRVEKLSDCSEADAKAEGADMIGVETGQVTESSHPIEIGSYRAGYAELWDSINGAGAWETNPWVWVVEFRRIDEQQ